MISWEIFAIASAIIYVVFFIYFGKHKINRYIGIILMVVIPGSYGVIMKGGGLIADLHLEKSETLQFVAFVFGVLYVVLLAERMKFKD